MKQIRFLGILLIACLMLFASTSFGAGLTKRELTIENRGMADGYCAYAYLMDNDDVRNTGNLAGFHVEGWVYIPSGRSVTIEYASNYGVVYVCLIAGNYRANPSSSLPFSVSKDLRKDSFKVIHEWNDQPVGDIIYPRVNKADLATEVFSRKSYGKTGWQLTTGIPGPIDIKKEDIVEENISPLPSEGTSEPEVEFDGVYNTREFVRQGKDYALLFATNNYVDNSWDDLDTPQADAEDLKLELENYGFEVELFRNQTLEDILSVLTKYAQIVFAPGDQLLVYFAGHGIYDYDTNSDGYIVASDSKDFLNTDPFYRSYLSHGELTRRLDRFKCDRIMLILDVCYGGTVNTEIAMADTEVALADVRKTRGGPSKIQKKRGVKPTLNLAKTLAEPTRWYMTSGGKQEVEDGLGRNSPFAKSLLKVLKTTAGNDGVLTVPEIEEALREIYRSELDKLEKVFKTEINLEPISGPFGSRMQSDKAFVFIKSK